jgi:hypothetical protein
MIVLVMSKYVELNWFSAGSAPDHMYPRRTKLMPHSCRSAMCCGLVRKSSQYHGKPL